RRFPEAKFLTEGDRPLAEEVNEIVAIDPVAGKPLTLNLTLDPGRFAEGRCVGPDGKALVSVHIRQLVDPNRDGLQVIAKSDNDGRFRIPACDGKTRERFHFAYTEKSWIAVAELNGSEP